MLKQHFYDDNNYCHTYFFKKIALKTESGGRYEHVEVDILLIPNSTARWMRQISGD